MLQTWKTIEVKENSIRGCYIKNGVPTGGDLVIIPPGDYVVFMLLHDTVMLIPILASGGLSAKHAYVVPFSVLLIVSGIITGEAY